MRDSIKPGLERTVTHTVDDARAIDFMGADLRVYATPAIVNDLEYGCRDLLKMHLPDEQCDAFDLREVVDYAIEFLDEGNVPPPGKGGRKTEWRYRWAVTGLIKYWPHEPHLGDTDIEKANPFKRWLAGHLMDMEPDVLRSEEAAIRKASTALEWILKDRAKNLAHF